MTTMRALVVKESGKAGITEIQQPRIRPDYVKIKVSAVALNPTDWKHIDALAEAGVVVGCDAAGQIVEIGSQVQADVSVGDRVYGFIHGSNNSNHEDGGFAEYAVLKDGLFGKTPAGMSDEAVSTLSLGLVTCGQALYQGLKLPLPSTPAPSLFPILIYGGSSATGMLAIQLAKASGLTVVATASKRHFQILKELGADEVVDYNDSECGAKIREYTKDKLYYAFDTIGAGRSTEICFEALSSVAPSNGLHYASLLPVESLPRKDVSATSSLAYTALGEAFQKGGPLAGKPFPPMPDHYQFIKEFFSLAAGLVAAGKVKPAKFVLKDGGLDGILDGLDDMKSGKVSGSKLVYKIGSA